MVSGGASGVGGVLVGKGAFTGYLIHEEIALALALLGVVVLALLWLSATAGSGGDNSYAAVILSDAQKQQLELLVLPETCIVSGEEAEEESSAGDAGDAGDDSSAAGGDAQSVPDSPALGTPKLRRRLRRGSSNSAWESAASRVRGMLGRVRRAPRRFSAERYAALHGHDYDRTPLLVFVNRKSGGQKGDLLLEQLRGFLPSWQVWDIGPKSPEEGLLFFKQVPNHRVLVAGGDGTAAWVLQTIDALALEYHPPLAVLPVGTGNDLARVLGWGGGLSGGGYAGNGLARQLLDTAIYGEPTKLDRWTIDIEEPVPVKPEAKKSAGKGGSSSSSSSSKRASAATVATPPRPPPLTDRKKVVLNNYLGVGVDAQISLNFHLTREASPHLFTSRLLNKYFWYVGSGGKEILLKRFSDFSQQVQLECDGRLVELPAGTEGIIILNIKSYGGGVDLWGDDTGGGALGSGSSGEDLLNSSADLLSEPGSGLQSADEFLPASFNDGMLEVLCVASSFQLGAAQVGLARPQRLCQCRAARIVTRDIPLPVQVDGEPFTIRSNATLSVTFLNQGTMLARSPVPGARTEAWLKLKEVESLMSKGLDWGVQTRKLTPEHRAALYAHLHQLFRNRARAQSTDSLF
jgi:hypothetical protein